MTMLVFLLEEPSARDLLEGLLPRLLPRLLPSRIRVQYVIFEGKQDLERNLARRIRGWLVPGSRLVVLRDQDAAPCLAVKQRLVELVPDSHRERVLIRVACRDLESWILGDWVAVGQAFEEPTLATNRRKAMYRHPDQLHHPLKELRKFIPAYQKRDGARRLGASPRPRAQPVFPLPRLLLGAGQAVRRLVATTHAHGLVVASDHARPPRSADGRVDPV